MEQKIPSRFVPQELEEYGCVTIVRHPHTAVKGTYSISTSDGRLSVGGWKEFMKKENVFQLGDKVLLLLYSGNQGLFLFVTDVPYIDPE